MTSVQLNGIELNDQSKASGIASGLGSATVSATKFGNSYIKITAQTSSSNTVVSNLTQYYIARNGFNNIYMATYVTSEPAVGELRYIFRSKFDELPNGPPHSVEMSISSLTVFRRVRLLSVRTRCRSPWLAGQAISATG